MADESVPQPKPAATPPPAQHDPEKEQLRAQAAEAAQLRSQMNQLAEMVQSGRLVLKEPEAQKAPEPEDDTALIDRRELKKHIEDFKSAAANAIVETTSQTARQMRGLAKDSLRSKLKNFDKYEAEIDALLEKIPDPRVAASAETIKQVHKLVRSQHIDEEFEENLAEKKREWEADLRAKGWEPEEIEEEVAERAEALVDEEIDETPRGGTRQAKPVARTSGVAPAGNASGARLAANRSRQAAPPLTREQRIVAERFGIRSAEEWHKYADPNYRHDSLGAKGRTKF